jgi:hypothetical protein
MNHSSQSGMTKRVSHDGDAIPNVPAREVVAKATEELRRLVGQRLQVTKQIETIKRTVAGLAEMFGQDVLTDGVLELIGRKRATRTGGLTAACRQILLRAPRPLRAIEVCDHLRREFPEILPRHKDPVASVTTVLNRLTSYGEARSVLENVRRTWVSVAAETSTSGERSL